MIVVADAGPLHYLILIGAVDVLGPLYNRVVLPEAVAQELRYQRAPAAVRAWISSLPGWAEIRPVPGELVRCQDSAQCHIVTAKQNNNSPTTGTKSQTEA